MVQQAAKIYVSYPWVHKSIVLPFIDALHKSYEVLMDDTLTEGVDDRQGALREAQKNADGTIVFYTSGAVKSEFMSAEIKLAKDYADHDGKFLISLVYGKVKLPRELRDRSSFHMEDGVETIMARLAPVIQQHVGARLQTANAGEQFHDYENMVPPEPGLETSHQGDHGSHVKKLQETLRDLGHFSGVSDSVYGPQTTEAVKQFQQRHGLEVTGEFDERTREEMQAMLQGGVIDKVETNESSFTQSSTPPAQNITDSTPWILYQVTDGDDPAKRPTNYSEWDWTPLVPNFFENGNASAEKVYVIPIVGSDQTVPLILLEQKTGPVPTSKSPSALPNYTIKIFGNAFPLKIPDIIKLIPTIEVKGQPSPQYLTKEEGEKLIQLITKGFIGNSRANESSLSEILTDSISGVLKDELDFQSDVDALAKVIAYKEVKPPLAIGLFGNWGSGKSFFMNQLQQKIKDLAINDKGVYCKEVVQINFNSWHYSDSNLWASLITKIFDDLGKYGKEKDDNTKLDNLFHNLNSTQELLADTKQEKIRVEQDIESMTKRQRLLNNEIKQNASRLSGMNLLEIAKEVWKDPVVENDLKEVKETYKFLNIKESEDIDKNIGTLKSAGGKVMQGLDLIYKFRVGKLKVALGFAVAFALISFLLIKYVDVFRQQFDHVKYLVISLAAVLSQVVAFIKPALKRVDDATERLTSLKKTMDGVQQRKMNAFNADREQIKAKLQAAQTSQNELKLKLEQLESKRGQLQIEINDIVSGKKIVRFIEGRVTDQRYVNSLGIISWIRKDFEELDFLLKQQYDPKRLEELKRQKIENVFEIDRIILYIDDLDRCDVSIVVRVLEAIHLLLAFPLFVVIVGVDPRWMHNALSIKYERFLNGKSIKPTNGTQTTSITNDISDTQPYVNGHAATSYDYLEKIFQIPFVLKPMEATGKSKLIKSQLEKKNGISVTGGSTPTGELKEKPNVDAGSSPTNAGNAKGGSESTGSTATTGSMEHGAPEAATTDAVATAPENDLLEISDEEICFMQNIGFLIGNSPRTIKRYTNIYRIIRTHTKYEFLDNNELSHYCASMILLAMITGLPMEAKQFFEEIEKGLDDTEFKAWLADYLSTRPNATLAVLQSKLDKDEFKPIRTVTLDKFKKNLDLAGRFSFRSLTALVEDTPEVD